MEENNIQWLEQFATGLELLDDYDHEQLDQNGLTNREAIYPEKEECQQLIDTMKTDFKSAVFRMKKDSSFDSVKAQIGSGFAGRDFYSPWKKKQLPYYI